VIKETELFAESVNVTDERNGPEPQSVDWEISALGSALVDDSLSGAAHPDNTQLATPRIQLLIAHRLVVIIPLLEVVVIFRCWHLWRQRLAIESFGDLAKYRYFTWCINR
jgi:hypothetical protein